MAFDSSLQLALARSPSCDTMALAFTTVSAARPSAAPAAPAAAAAPAAGTHGSGRGLVAAGLAACGLVAARERRQGKAATSGSAVDLHCVSFNFLQFHADSASRCLFRGQSGDSYYRDSLVACRAQLNGVDAPTPEETDQHMEPCPPLAGHL